MKPIVDLKNKAVIVTGAGTGIGEAIAHKFASLGAKVLCAGLPGDPVEEVAASIRKKGSKAVAFEGDLSHPEMAQACVDLAVEKFRKLDVVINNAGVVLVSDSTDKISDEAFTRTVHNNVFTSFYVTRAALPELKKTRGVLLFNSSVAGLKGEPGNSIYGGTKGFLNAFVQSLAVEQAQNGIRVNAVLPGVTDTAMTHSARTAYTKNEEKKMTEHVPMRRRATPEEIANAFVFLASDLASYISGVLLPVDGAYTLSWGGVDEVPQKLRRKPKGSLDAVLKHSRAGGFKKNNPEPRSKH